MQQVLYFSTTVARTAAQLCPRLGAVRGAERKERTRQRFLLPVWLKLAREAEFFCFFLTHSAVKHQAEVGDVDRHVLDSPGGLDYAQVTTLHAPTNRRSPQLLLRLIRARELRRFLWRWEENQHRACALASLF